MSRGRTVAVGAGVLLALLVVGSVLMPGRTWLKAVALGADALDLPLPRPFAPAVERSRPQLGGVTVDRYAPGGTSPGIVLVPGATPQGLDDPRVTQVARALARSRRDVVLPELALYDEDLTRRDVGRIRRVIVEHAAATGGPVVVIGISYGGSLALIAAAQVPEDVGATAVFGAYGDLIGVIQAVTTDTSVVGERRIDWQGHPRAREVLQERAVELLPPEERGGLTEALAGEREPDELNEPARRLHALLTNTDPDETYDLAAALPGSVLTRLQRLSPVHEVRRAPGGATILHAVNDPLVPFAEALRLHHAIDDTLLLPLESFGHVEAGATAPRTWWRFAGDLRRIWRFAVEVLAPHEALLPG